LPRNLLWLLLYLLLAGLSISWAFAADVSFKRYGQLIMVVTCITLPIIVTRETDSLISDLFICFALAVCINFAAIFTIPPTKLGFSGIYGQKNQLGLIAALAFLLSLHEVCRGSLGRRLLGAAVLGVAAFLLLASGSKTSLGIAVLAPLLAGLSLSISISFGVSPAGVITYLCALIASVMFIASDIFKFDQDDVLTFMFGDPTFSGRTTIWAFVSDMIERKPLLGWGYQSFWLVGPEAPSVREAPGFVAFIFDAHNGYLDTVLQTGFLGLVLLVILIISSISAAGRLAKTHVCHAWLVVSLLLFIALHNGMESTLVRSGNILWLVFLIAATVGGLTGRVGSKTPV
jgi:O-antigen ligase